MKLLWLNHYPIFGGPHNRVLRLRAFFEDSGWHPIVLLPDDLGDADERLRAGGVETIKIPLGRARRSLDPRLAIQFFAGLWTDTRRIRRIIHERDIDLVVLGGLINPHGAIAGRLEKVPVVWQIVDTRTPAAARMCLMPLVERLADVTMSGGKSVIEFHTGKRALRVPNYVYFPPVDTDLMMPSRSFRRETRTALGIPPDAPVVGTVANLNPQKGIEYFIWAAKRIASKYPDAWFLIVGPFYRTHEKYTQRIMDEIEKTKMDRERFIFTGGRPDVERYYPAMDVKLITSVPKSEATTTTAMEAMACGVPVVATDVGGVREVVHDGVSGLLVPPLDEDALARATIELIASPTRRMEMGRTGRDIAVKKFGLEASASAHLQAFEAALARGRRTS